LVTIADFLLSTILRDKARLECMKGVVCHGPKDVRIDDRPKPKVEHPEDIILKITKTAI
jgi:hypothetical protein